MPISPAAICLPVFLVAVMFGNSRAVPALEPAYWEAAQLQAMKRKVAQPDAEPKLKGMIASLRSNADEALQRGPYSVMNKKETPPSGDKHDYMSFSRYWWPDPEKPNGLPYIRHDGEVNVKLRQRGDRDQIGQLFDDVQTLTLAYYFSGEIKYADHAASLIRTWYLDPATKMNPNANFGQAVPGRAVGRGVGILDTRGNIKLLDAIALLQGSGSLSEEEHQGLKDWFTEYLHWLRTSDLGKKEASAENNHGSWYAAQVARIALFVGDIDVAREIVSKVQTDRIPKQFEPDGSQPAELKRTQSLHYSFFNFEALSIVARVGERLGMDLWNPSEVSQGLKPGIQFLLPYITGEKDWTYPQIRRFSLSNGANNLLRMASVRYRDPAYLKPIGAIPRRRPRPDFGQLMFRTFSESTESHQGAVVTVSENVVAVSSEYELPDVSEFSPQNIMHRIPVDFKGVAQIVPTAGEVILAETFRKNRLQGFQDRQGVHSTATIKVQGGAIKLDEVVRQIDDEEVVSLKDGVITLRLPILVASDATLVIDGSETHELRLSTDRGALIANAGNMYIVDTKVTSWDEQSSSPTEFRTKDEFRPFIASYIRSQTFFTGSTFHHLGYHAPTSYGVSLSSQPEREDPNLIDEWPTGAIVGCEFHGLYYGFYSFEARSVVILDNKYSDCIVYGIDPHDRSTELVIARNTTSGTREKHGIIGSRGISNSYIFENTSFANTGSGIMLDRQCSGNVVCRNKVYANGQGIAIYESPSNVITDNLLVDNKKSGIRVRNSNDILITKNKVVANGDYGIEVSAKRLDDHAKRIGRNDQYVQSAEVEIFDNEISRNRRGVLKGQNVSYLGLSQIFTKVDLAKIETAAGISGLSARTPANNPFGSDLKPFAEQLSQVFDENSPLVEFRRQPPVTSK